MADTSKYYWLKLKRDFFKRHDIRIIEEMPNGKDYILFYLKLLLESIDHEGELRFSDAIPYNEQMLSVITNTNIDIVRSAMKVFIELRMIDILDDKTIFMVEVQKLIGSESKSAQRVRKHREQQKALQCNTVETKCNIEIDIEKEIEKEKENIGNTEQKRKRFTPPTLEEVQAYCDERQNNVNAERFIDHYTANGWQVGKNKMRDWKAAVRNWERNGYSEKQTAPQQQPKNEYNDFMAKLAALRE